jgi:hypothetical protein
MVALLSYLSLNVIAPKFGNVMLAIVRRASRVAIRREAVGLKCKCSFYFSESDVIPTHTTTSSCHPSLLQVPVLPCRADFFCCGSTLNHLVSTVVTACSIEHAMEYPELCQVKMEDDDERLSTQVSTALCPQRMHSDLQQRSSSTSTSNVPQPQKAVTPAMTVEAHKTSLIKGQQCLVLKCKHET